MRRMFAALLAASCMAAHGQAIEDVLVETYAVSADPGGGPALVTYRIFLDLAPGYGLQLIYGDEAHRLTIGSTAPFFNDTVNGGKFADEVDADLLHRWPLALDSWLTIGIASDGHRAVPKALDPDGSVLECPPYTRASGIPGERYIPPCIADGLVADTAHIDVVDFRFASGYLHRMRGDLLQTNDGAWAVLGRVRGVTPENMVLVAQITTARELRFELNAQVVGPDGVAMKYVASAPGPGETHFPGLARGVR